MFTDESLSDSNKSYFWTYFFTGFGLLMVMAYFADRYFMKVLAPYIVNLESAGIALSTLTPSVGPGLIWESKPHKNRLEPLIEFLKVCLNPNISNNKFGFMLAGLKCDEMIHHQIYIIIQPSRIKKLKNKLVTNSEQKPIQPLDAWELYFFEHIEYIDKFWGAVINWIKDCYTDNKPDPIVAELELRTNDIHSIHTFINENNLDKLIGDTINAIFKDAHISIFTSTATEKLKNDRSNSNFCVNTCAKISNLTMFTEYTSSGAVAFLGNELNHYALVPTIGYRRAAIKNTEAALAIPFKVNLKPLCPDGVTSHQRHKLNRIFNRNFHRRVNDANFHSAFSNSGLFTAICNKFWPNWGMTKQSFDQEPLNGNPEKQLCSSMLAQDLWFAFKAVHNKLKAWGFSGLKNPFGDYQRLDTLLPEHIVKLGIEKGWLLRVVDPVAKQLYETPETPPACKEILSKRSRMICGK